MPGVLDEYGVEMIGAKRDAIKVAEDRRAVQAGDGRSWPADAARRFCASRGMKHRRSSTQTGYPAIIRPSFTLGGTGGGTAYNPEEFEEIVRAGLAASPIHEVLIEESILGWKEFELEVMRDLADNVVIICSIENFDPMGVHTGDSITVAPAQTLTDRRVSTTARHGDRVIRKVGVETGGSNIQFAVNPENGDDSHHRNEPARVAFVGACFESDRISDRQDRRQARGRLHARRDSQRHHEEDAGVV